MKSVIYFACLFSVLGSSVAFAEEEYDRLRDQSIPLSERMTEEDNAKFTDPKVSKLDKYRIFRDKYESLDNQPPKGFVMPHFWSNVKDERVTYTYDEQLWSWRHKENLARHEPRMVDKVKGDTIKFYLLGQKSPKNKQNPMWVFVDDRLAYYSLERTNHHPKRKSKVVKDLILATDMPENTLGERWVPGPCRCVFNEKRKLNPRYVWFEKKFWECENYLPNGECVNVIPARDIIQD